MASQGEKSMSAEDRAYAAMRKHGFPVPDRNYRFDKERLWRFDFAWLDLIVKRASCSGGYHISNRGKVVCHTPLLHYHKNLHYKDHVKVALEIEGRGRHQTASGYAKDCEKYNAAQIQGWLVIRVPTSALSNEEWLVDVFDALKLRGGIE